MIIGYNPWALTTQDDPGWWHDGNLGLLTGEGINAPTLYLSLI